ncbi:MAG TPA: hypothetical protein VEU53_03040 [Stellaceae bacterium]|nr:hypothetical protein [Stellaceae bacterium]
MVREPLASPVYTITLLKNGRYGVKAAAVAGSPATRYHEFLSRSAADEWIERDRRALGLKPARQHA